MRSERLLAWGMEVARRALERGGARSRYLQAGALRMHYFEHRASSPGPTALLVHGLGGSALGWGRVMFRLAGVGRVVAPDLPGSGFSPLPASGPLGFGEVMEALERFAEEVVPERSIVIGNSLGGAMAARLAATRPDKVSALVLVSPAGGRVEPKRMQELIEGFQVQTQREARALSRRFFSRPPLLLPFLLGPTLLPLMARPAVRRLLEEALKESALRDEELESLAMPVLLLWAKNERVLPYEALGHFRRHLPRTARIEEVEGFGHSPQLDKPGELAERVVRFLADEGLLG